MKNTGFIWQHQSGNIPFTPLNPFGHPPIETSFQVRLLRERSPQAGWLLRARFECGFVFFTAAIRFDKKRHHGAIGIE
jgi:hypothetical protein